MTICAGKECCEILEALRDEARLENSTPLYNSSWQVIGMPHQDDGLPLVLSAIVCWFGSWVGSDKGATWHFTTGRSPLPLLKLSILRRDLKIDHTPNPSGQAIATPLRDDGLPLVLSAVVCLFGSWVGSDKGAT